MKKSITFMITALMLMTTSLVWAQTRDEVVAYSLDGTITGGSNGYATESEITQNGITWMVTGNTTLSPWRIGGKNLTGVDRPVYSTTPIADNITKIDVTHGTANDITVNSATLIVSSNSNFSNPTSTLSGDFAANATITFTRPLGADWTGMYYKIIYNVTVSVNSNKFLQFISAEFYKEAGGGQQQTVATPTFSPAGGIYTEAQNVTIHCTTDGAAIHYTTDGTEPTENSDVYRTSICVSTTTTLKAKAFLSGYTASGVASATYTFPTLVTIAEARAIANNEYAQVQGIVTFIDGRNIYIQDATGGIDLYLNSNTVPSSLALGDMVLAFGKKTIYNGLVELTGIAGGDALQFSIISTGNTLPLTVKTIAEILSDHQSGDALQSTRVKIVNATIGTINPSNNTPITQGENSLNIYKVPALDSIEEGNAVDVIGVISCYNNPQLRVAYASDVVIHIDPELNVSVTELSGFQYTHTNGPSLAQSFSVTGLALSANVTVTATQDYEIALTENGNYSGSLNITPTQGAVSQTLYVRLKTGLDVGEHNGSLSVASGDLSQTVTLTGAVSEQPTAQTPTFSPAGGYCITTQSVTIECATEGASIHYTTDGSTPTENSPVYSEPITISSTTTLKAIAIASGYQNSSEAEATYTFREIISIAEARALEINQYTCVEGTVTFIDGRNVYVQDATAGIVLFLNNNTVPSTLAIGNKVRAYGKRAVYNGLVELSGIKGNNTSEFAVVATQSPLPLAVKSIAEINEDYNGSNMLQSTRVIIEEAIIGAINPNSNTVITQDGSSLNIYHIPNVEGMIQGDLVTVIGIVGCYNAPQLRVARPNDITYIHRPVLTATPASLSGMNYTFESGGPSEITYFELAGNYLNGPAQVYPSENFEISTMPGTYFNPEVPANVYNPGSFYGIKIYVRLKANLEAGTYNERLYAVSEGADTLFVNVSGTVTSDTPTPPTPGGDNYVRISELGSLTAGSHVVVAARFDENATEYYAMSNTSSGKPVGVLFTSTTNEGDEILPASIVDEEDSYYWVVGITDNGYTFTNAAGEMIGYGASGTDFVTGGEKTVWNIEVSTAGESAMVPNHTGFYITNATTTGRGFALNSNHNYGAYAVSNNNSSGYNFYLDLFVKAEGGVPPTPTVATPTFTPEAGTYYEAQTVSIACATEGATIYYSTTSEAGPWTAYTSALTVSENTTIWAYAEKEGYDDSPVASAAYVIQLGFATIFNQDWEGEMNGWTFVDVAGEASWSIASYSGNHYAYANGYNHGANTDWCISPAFNLDAYTNPTLSFRTATKFDGNVLEVLFSNDYDGEDPTEATWTALTCELSTGNYTWVESGDIDLSNFSGTNCYIGFKYTCEESSAAGWEVDDILLVGQTSEPVVTVTPLTLSGFTYIEANGPSAEQSFSVSALNLSGNITVSEATDYEISLASGDDFTAQATLTLTPTNGNLEETTVYVRLKAGLAVGDYNNEVITISCSDVANIEITCSGSVSEQPVPGDDYVRISDAGTLVAGNRVILAARYNETTDAYVAIQNTLTSGKLATTEFTSAMNGDDEIIPADIIADEDSYYWTVGITTDGYTFTNAAGDIISYGSGTNFAMNGEKTDWTITAGTSDESAMVPNYFGFNIINVNTNNRAFALNANHVCGAYHTQNITSADYNFFLDIFMQGEGGVPPTPTVATPTFTPAGGTYYETQEVTISCATEGATIWYSFIAEGGPWNEYTEAISVDENMTIWAYASKEGYNDSPVVNAEYIIQNDIVVIFNQDWEDDWNGWTQVNVTGEEEWTIASHSGNHYAYMNGYSAGAAHENEDWLISPAFDLDNNSDAVLTFLTAMNYTGPNIEVLFSNDYDGTNPSTATWQALECELSSGSWNWTGSGEIDLSGFSGSNCYIAYKYTSTDEAAAGWEIDDIMLVSGTNASPSLVATPNTLSGLDYYEGYGPSNSQSYTLTGANLVGEGDVTLTASQNFEISLDDEDFFTTLYVQYADGQLVDQPVTIYVRLMEGLEVGTYTGSINHEGGEATTEVILNGTVHSEDEPMMIALMPFYIQGNNGSNNNRVPVAFPVMFANLQPNTTYRYTNQLVDSNDSPETAGAGNVIYVSEEGFYRSTSPSLSTEGGYGEFTTDDEGDANVWLMNEPTANTRFTPGNHVFLRIRLNDGNDGTTVDQAFTSNDYATVINFGNENDEYSGSAFYVKSNETPMTFALLFTDDTELRPVYSTSIETTGVDYGSINQYADFYKENVAGEDGWFGGILPNVNETGINFIATISLDSETIHFYYGENGQWAPEANTVNPSNGLDEPIFIDLFDDGVEETAAANVKVWNTDNVFVIENGDNAHYIMTVYNILGQPMMQKQINAGSTDRISHNLAAGVYVINLQNNQSKVSVKIIVR